MLLAVNIPEQEPQVGQLLCSTSCNPSSVMTPFCTPAAAEKMEIKSRGSWLSVRPASIGPPLVKIVGILQRTEAISIPGTILSQLGIQIIPSNLWALIIVSTESAIISRLAREYFIPSCPIATPSHTPIVLKINGTPPASLTHFATNSATSWRWTCPGMISTWLLTIAMKGRLKSLSESPQARKRPRWGARLTPLFISSERIFPNTSYIRTNIQIVIFKTNQR